MWNRKHRIILAQVVAGLLALAIIVPVELVRTADSGDGPGGLAGWLFGINIDTTPYLLLFVVAPFLAIRCRSLFGIRGPWHSTVVSWLSDSPVKRQLSNRSSHWIALAIALLVGICSIGVSVRLSSDQVGGLAAYRFGDLPPAYHDEYSYLFQAKTFLAGRLWFPSHPTAPRLFDQMHVLNEGRFASRYFPGVGLWIAPFLALGHAYWGHWLAGAMTAMLVFGIGRELANNGIGLLAGLLTALSPGMGVFSNLLLSHHPTLVGLSLFLFCFLRMQRRRSRCDALLAGLGLSFAMLCRPMTAFGIGLPFGIWFAWSLLRPPPTEAGSAYRRQFLLAGCLAAPLLAGLLAMYGYNRALTGNGWTTPYQVYTDIYTPRHVYGFNNVVRGERKLGPRVLENYDRWAENLTGELAVKNVRNRLIASWQWTVGIIPLLLGTIVFLIAGPGEDKRWWFIPAAIVSLHAVHVPYWFDGIMHWHYVFESGPLWTLILASATLTLIRAWTEWQRPRLGLWWVAVIATTVLVNFFSIRPFWEPSRVVAGLDEIAFARLQYEAFDQTLHNAVDKTPALVLIEPDPADRHIDFVVNEPSLTGDILLGRFQPDANRSKSEQLAEILDEFPDRTCYLFDAATWQLIRVGSGPRRGREDTENKR